MFIHILFDFLGFRTRFDRNTWKSESANRKENNSEGEFSFLSVVWYKVEQQNCTRGARSGWGFVFAALALPCWASLRAVLHICSSWCGMWEPGQSLSCPTGPGVAALPRHCLHCHLHGLGKACASLHLPWPFNFHLMYFIVVQQKKSIGFWWRGWLLILL